VDKSLKDKNIQIPLSLFNRIVELMDSLDPPDDDLILLFMFDAVLKGLRSKRISMLHRCTYTAVVCAEDDEKRKDALNNYVQTKLYYKDK
jgi:hypothetical protein